jgi:predicted metal-dependent hydrolase
MPGQLIGKSHRLEFVGSPSARRASVRLSGQTVRVTYPLKDHLGDQQVQQAAQRGSIKALQQQAEALLPDRLATLAKQHGFTYSGVSIKHLRSKWGSCDHRAHITLNVFLMTLPWELIDYVLVHELVHTKVLRHGEPFWREMAQHLPHVEHLRKQLRTHQPAFRKT